MPMRTYYEILGVPRSATPAQIQSAFRRLAMQWHPDRNRHADATARFREINDAYQCLRNDATRAAYDATLRPAGANDGAWRSGPWGDARDDTEPRAAGPWAEFDARLTLRPQTLIALFTRIDAWLRRAFSHSSRRTKSYM